MGTYLIYVPANQNLIGHFEIMWPPKGNSGRAMSVLTRDINEKDGAFSSNFGKRPLTKIGKK